MKFTMTSKLALALATLFLTAECAPAAAAADAATSDAPAVFSIPEDPYVLYTPGPDGPLAPYNTKPLSARSSENPGNALTKRLINDCGDSTFENRVSAASPYVSDCWRLHDNIAGDGTWTVWGPGHRTIATYGTCAFGVTVTGITWINIGNGDVRDLVRDSINGFQWDGKVGTRGFMDCQPGSTTVEWGIYHT